MWQRIFRFVKIMFKKISTYWWCQIFGWGTNVAISVFFALTVSSESKIDTFRFFISVVASSLIGVFVTHIMRMNIHGLKVLEKSLKTQIVYLISLTFVFAFLYGVAIEAADNIIKVNPDRLIKYSKVQRLFFSTFNALWLLLVWNMLYYLYHYVERNRRQELDTFRLRAAVKDLELKTIKAHINPHFIFNALNSIRALVDENPQRARRAITELSNILRSSMQAEKMETVPLQQELDIVKDYLALEHMRFEERLKIELDIDEDTLNQPVPPMMLQTLVENAIKHGIGRQIDGGTIKIISRFYDHHHELIVQNPGTLNSYVKEPKEGFGIKSTQDRLNLLFQGKAIFELKEVNGNTVESKVVMPLASIL